VRGKFVHLHQSAIAAQALDRVGALYAIEQQIRGWLPDERLAVRQERSRPLFDALHAWFEQTLATLSQKSATAKAIRYALSRWEALG
jgi:transposase